MGVGQFQLDGGDGIDNRNLVGWHPCMSSFAATEMIAGLFISNTISADISTGAYLPSIEVQGCELAKVGV